nr:uncharacterized protein LOC113690475 [Coffea arabica]
MFHPQFVRYFLFNLFSTRNFYRINQKKTFAKKTSEYCPPLFHYLVASDTFFLRISVTSIQGIFRSYQKLIIPLLLSLLALAILTLTLLQLLNNVPDGLTAALLVEVPQLLAALPQLLLLLLLIVHGYHQRTPLALLQELLALLELQLPLLNLLSAPLRGLLLPLFAPSTLVYFLIDAVGRKPETPTTAKRATAKTAANALTFTIWSVLQSAAYRSIVLSYRTSLLWGFWEGYGKGYI